MADNLSSGTIINRGIAIMLDLFGFGCLLFSLSGDADAGLSLSFMPDILGLLFLGGPRLFKKRNRSNKGKGFLFTVLGEFCPFVGDILPLWSISVWKQKK